MSVAVEKEKLKLNEDNNTLKKAVDVSQKVFEQIYDAASETGQISVDKINDIFEKNKPT